MTPRPFRRTTNDESTYTSSTMYGNADDVVMFKSEHALEHHAMTAELRTDGRGAHQAVIVFEPPVAMLSKGAHANLMLCLAKELVATAMPHLPSERAARDVVNRIYRLAKSQHLTREQGDVTPEAFAIALALIIGAFLLGADPIAFLAYLMLITAAVASTWVLASLITLLHRAWQQHRHEAHQ